MRVDDWFLTTAERGNAATRLDHRHADGLAWSVGNEVTPLVHGAAYFARLVDTVRALGRADLLCFTDWRGDADERLTAAGDDVGGVLSAAAKAGVDVRGLVWRSHSDALSFSESENRDLADEVTAAGGEVLLDERVRRGGSHHQKLVVVRHADDADQAADTAFVGGIDLCHSRHDDGSHAGDPQHQPMAKVYGERPPWHDVQVQVRGPAVADLETVFRERWEDPHPLDHRNPVRRVREASHREHRHPTPLPAQRPDPPAAGPHAVQLLRTYPARRPGYPFAPRGERSVARGYGKALRRARRLIYLEDQYMWSVDVARLFAAALRDNPELHLVVVVPRHPDQDGRLQLPPNLVGREEALRLCQEAGGDRVGAYDVESPTGVPVYVHAKVCVVDDTWASVGSDNLNRRSWSHDSELACAVLDETRDSRAPLDPGGRGDGARRYARDLRLTLWREHLDRAPDGSGDDGLLDPADAVAAFRAAAERLDAWYAAGRRGPRPPGRVRPHRPERLSRPTRMWSVPIYKTVYDPDGRPLAMRATRRW